MTIISESPVLFKKGKTSQNTALQSEKKDVKRAETSRPKCNKKSTKSNVLNENLEIGNYLILENNNL